MRAAIYARVSTDEQTEGRTIDSQIRDLERFAEAQHHTVVDRYIDEGWSGSLLSRPALDRLRDDATNPMFQVVLITDVDRLSRDVANLAVVKRDLEAKGVKLVFQKLPNDNSPLADFMVNILGSFAEFERAMIRDRTRRGRRFKAQERQLVVGNIPPYGFRYVKKDREHGIEGHYAVNPEEAAVVRMIYAWVGNDGLSGRATARKLRALGIPPRKGRRWVRSSIHRILTNETYMGTTYYNKHEAVARSSTTIDGGRSRHHQRGRRLRDKADWIPIRLPDELRLIPRDLFERVQAQLARNRAFSPRTTRYFYLLRGVRRVCGRCGAAYVACPSHGRRFYRCLGRDPTEGRRCRASLVSAQKIERAVWQAVEQAVQNPQLLTEQVRGRQNRQRDEAATADAKLSDLQGQLATVEQEEARVLAAYRQGVTTLQQFEKEIATVNARRVAVERLLQEARRSPRESLDHPATARSVGQWSQALRRRLHALTDNEKQQLLGCLLNEIRIDGDVIRIRGEIPAHDPGRYTVSTPIEGLERCVALPFAFTLRLDRTNRPGRASETSGRLAA
jgi:site-specific DNA recombinase